MHLRLQGRCLLAALGTHGFASLLVLAVGIVLPAAPERAVAAEVPPQNATPLQVTKPDTPVPQQTFQAANEIQWFKIDLKKGKDYAISGVHVSEEANYFPNLTLFNAAGRQFLSFGMTEDSTDFVAGSEFRAPATARRSQA
jgi:hypothetical protein